MKPNEINPAREREKDTAASVLLFGIKAKPGAEMSE